ncbi:MAG: hypothetical protein GXY86_17630 [Firmicutes bacterium]|nr:hypothetical protein [Bacillota bacterium]
MDTSLKAIEATGIIDSQKRLILDHPLPVAGPAKVRIIILLPEKNEPSEQEWYQAADFNQAFDFLREPEEDIYSPNDGRPFNDKG